MFTKRRYMMIPPMAVFVLLAFSMIPVHAEPDRYRNPVTGYFFPVLTLEQANQRAQEELISPANPDGEMLEEGFGRETHIIEDLPAPAAPRVEKAQTPSNPAPEKEAVKNEASRPQPEVRKPSMPERAGPREDPGQDSSYLREVRSRNAQAASEKRIRSMPPREIQRETPPDLKPEKRIPLEPSGKTKVEQQKNVALTHPEKNEVRLVLRREDALKQDILTVRTPGYAEQRRTYFDGEGQSVGRRVVRADFEKDGRGKPQAGTVRSAWFSAGGEMAAAVILQNKTGQLVFEGRMDREMLDQLAGGDMARSAAPDFKIFREVLGSSAGLAVVMSKDKKNS